MLKSCSVNGPGDKAIGELVAVRMRKYCNSSNLAVMRFYFKALYHAVTIRGRLDFKGGIYRDRHACAYTASIISLFVCTYNARAHT